MKQNIYVFSPQLPGLLLLSFVYLMKHNMSSLHNSRAFVLPSFVAFVLTSSSNSQLPTNKTGTCDVDPRSNETFNENYRTNSLSCSIIRPKLCKATASTTIPMLASTASFSAEVMFLILPAKPVSKFRAIRLQVSVH